MKYIKKFENYRIEKHREEIIKESVLQVNDIYKVKTMIDIPQSLINAYVKKVKDTTGKNLRQFFGDVDVAEEIVKYINLNNLDVDKIPGNALMGGTQTVPQAEGEIQPEGQPVAETQPQAQPQAQSQPEGQPQVQTEAQPQGEFEEPQAQAQEGEESQEESEEKGEGVEGEETQAQGETEEEELPL